MAVISEGNNIGDLLKMEAPQFYSRDEVTVKDGQTLSLGSVVSIKTADGKVYVLAPAAVDGTEDAVGVLLEASEPSGADGAALMLARFGIVSDAALVWPGGITDPQKADAVAQLKALGILVRQGV